MAQRQSTHYFYQQRINRLLNAISRDISREYDLEYLAELACLSPFHLHRIFTAMLGETPGACVRRLRLENAANILRACPDESVTNIAHSCGFSSAQNFARMFRDWAGVSPTEFRTYCQALCLPPKLEMQKSKQGNAAPFLLEYLAAQEHISACLVPNLAIWAKGANMNVTVKEMPPYRVAYARHIGPYGQQLQTVWGKLMAWAGKNKVIGPESIFIGVSWDNPELTPPERCRYDACIVIPEDCPLQESEGIGIQSLEGGLYACYRRMTRMDEYALGWNELFGIWLPQNNYQCAGMGYEYYHPQEHSTPDAPMDVSFCIRVKKMSA